MASKPVKFIEFVDALYAQNSRIVHTETAPGCWIIDPGLPPTGEDIVKYLADKALTPEAIILTHAHADHIAGVPQVLETYPALPVFLAQIEWPFLKDPAQNLSNMGGFDIRVEAPDLRDLQPGQALTLGSLNWQILDTSGHSPGGRTLYCAQASAAIVGDSLFAGSIGRVDFPHSDGPLLLANIREKLLTLPGRTRVYSGHGPTTTIEVEQATNPFLGGMNAT